MIRMLSYEFSKREKFLLVVLGVLLVFVLWFELVFQNVQTQYMNLDSQIGEQQTRLATDQGLYAKYGKMKEEIADYEAKGTPQQVVPKFDNTKDLMTELTVTLAGVKDLQMEFDDVVVPEDGSGTIQRPASISFGCGSYAEAEAIVMALSRGVYPCSIDSMDIDDGTAKADGSSGDDEAPVDVALGVTFYERQ